jgi:hypothetical protein
MVTSIQEIIGLSKEFNKFKTDKKRLDYIYQHRDKLKLILDNDQTNVEPICNEALRDVWLGKDLEFNSFDEYIGWAEGVFTLLAFFGIKAESV